MSARLKAQDATGIIAEDPGNGATIKYGPTVPTDGSAGYSKGCLFLHTDGASGNVLLVNDGTNQACDFNPLPSKALSTATAALTTITHTDPSAADYAISAGTSSTPFGFANANEFNTAMAVIRNLQLRVLQLEARG